MLKMMTYSEANAVLGSSLSPGNYCICKLTAVANGADPTPLSSFEYNRLIPVNAVLLPQSLQQYTITFAEGRTYNTGIYYIMNDNSIVKVGSQEANNISAANVTAIAYLASNASDSFVIDTVESSQINFGYPNVNSQLEAEAIYGIGGYHGSAVTTALKSSQNSNSPMPVITYCNQRGNDWYIPTSSEFITICTKILDINTAMNFVNGTQLSYSDINSSQWNEYYTPSASDSYWTCTYTESDLSEVACIGPTRVATTRTTYDPETSQPVQTTTYSYTYSQVDASVNDSYKVRLLKSINIAAPQVATGDVYQTMTVNAGVTPSPNTPTKSGYDFDGWSPTLHAADKDEIYIANWEEHVEPGGGDSPAIYAWSSVDDRWIASGGTIKPIVGETSVSLMWEGVNEPSGTWVIVASGPQNIQGGGSTWGSGYLNNIGGASSVGADVRVYLGGSLISGSWSVEWHSTGS